jgi:hypothetical protein
LELGIRFYEIIIFMLVYGGLFLYTLLSVSSENRIIAYINSAFLMVLYVIISTILWFTYKGEEYHINNHSGYESISYTSEAILIIVGFTIYSIILLLLGIYLKHKIHSKNP